MQTQTENITLVVVYCANCGVPFGLEEDYRQRRVKSHAGFLCPNGHSNVYSGETELERKLREEKETAKWWQERAEETGEALQSARSELTVTRRNLTRTKNRIAKGVCPCCNRQFVDLHRHMEGQHPDYKSEQK